MPAIRKTFLTYIKFKKHLNISQMFVTENLLKLLNPYSMHDVPDRQKRAIAFLPYKRNSTFVKNKKDFSDHLHSGQVSEHAEAIPASNSFPHLSHLT
jgi:hypothetical protein